MKLEDILTLVKAGYTREEIAKLETPEPPAKPASSTETPEKAAPAATSTQPAKAPEETPEPEAQETYGKQIMNAIGDLTAAIQKMNVQNASIPGGGEELTAEDMIANIINPPMKPKGGK